MTVKALILRIFLSCSSLVLRLFFALKAKNNRRTTEERAKKVCSYFDRMAVFLFGKNMSKLSIDSCKLHNMEICSYLCNQKNKIA